MIYFQWYNVIIFSELLLKIDIRSVNLLQHEQYRSTGGWIKYKLLLNFFFFVSINLFASN